MAYIGTPNYSHTSRDARGLLLTNLGTPEAPTSVAVRKYLAEFLADPRVIEVPRPIWWLVLHGVILRIRPRRSAALYRKVWTERGSPLMEISRRQALALQKVVETRIGGPVNVALGMRYGKPSIAQALEELRGAGVRRLLVLPLYPQYSSTTTASTFDAVADVLKTWRWLPELRFVTHYHDHSDYIEALAESVRDVWEEHGPAERLLFSFHGLPKRYFLAGDPYFCECQKTARLVAEHLKLSEERWALSFQSRVGREEWLKPYTDHLLREWGKVGLKSVAVMCPGFSADCLETLEEIAEQNREFFLKAGGGSFHYIGALNDRPTHIEALANLVLAHTRDWWEGSGVPGGEIDRQLEVRLNRAIALGARH